MIESIFWAVLLLVALDRILLDGLFTDAIASRISGKRK